MELFGRLQTYKDDMSLVGLVASELVVRSMEVVQDTKHPKALVESTSMQGR